MPNATTIAPDGATISIRYTGTPPSHEMMAAAVTHHMNSKKPSPRKPAPVPVIGRPSPPTQSLQAASAPVPQWRRTIDNTFGTGNHEGDIHQRLSGVVPGVKAAFNAANQWSDGIGEKLLSITGGTTTVQNITPAQHAANARRLLAQAKQSGAALIPPTVKDIAAGVPARTIVGNTLREARDHPFNFALNVLPFAEWGALSVLGKAAKLERMAAAAEEAGNAAQAAQMRTYAVTLRRGAQPVHDAVTAKPLRQAVGKGVAALRKPPIPPAAATPSRGTPAPPRVSPATNDAELARQVAPPGWIKPASVKPPRNIPAVQTYRPRAQRLLTQGNLPPSILTSAPVLDNSTIQRLLSQSPLQKRLQTPGAPGQRLLTQSNLPPTGLVNVPGIGRLTVKGNSAAHVWGPDGNYNLYTIHGLHQVIGRDGGKGIRAIRMLETLRNPKSIVMQTDGRVKVIGPKVNVIFNKDGNIITVTGSSRGPQLYFNPSRRTKTRGGGPAQRKANSLGFSYYPGYKGLR